MNADSRSEGVEALVYPSDDLMKNLKIERDTKDESLKDQILQVIKGIVDKVNKTLQPYARISKITILDKALEMTTSKKVKRNYKKIEESEKKIEKFATNTTSTSDSSEKQA